jgi:hypothetical protein
VAFSTVKGSGQGTGGGRVNLHSYVRWDVVLGLVLMCALTGWEFYGVANPRMLTITAFLKSWMPMAVRIMIWAWLGWHFILSDLVREVQR